MAITVTMIEEKEFKTKVRGYDPVEVDEFLDEICDEMIEMQGTIQTLRDQLKRLTLPTEMGERFQVMGFSRDVDLSAAFAMGDLTWRL